MLQPGLNDFPQISCVLTNPQLPQVALKLWFFLQHLQQVSRFHALQLHFVVDVDFVVEADVNQAGSVLTILTGILTWRRTKLKVRWWSEAPGEFQRHHCLDGVSSILALTHPSMHFMLHFVVLSSFGSYFYLCEKMHCVVHYDIITSSYHVDMKWE